MSLVEKEHLHASVQEGGMSFLYRSFLYRKGHELSAVYTASICQPFLQARLYSVCQVLPERWIVACAGSRGLTLGGAGVCCLTALFGTKQEAYLSTAAIRNSF